MVDSIATLAFSAWVGQLSGMHMEVSSLLKDYATTMSTGSSTECHALPMLNVSSWALCQLYAHCPSTTTVSHAGLTVSCSYPCVGLWLTSH